MPCKYCNVQFTLIKWKTRCHLCTQLYCSSCTIQKKCLACRNVLETQLDYGHLMKLKVKDLKIYLESRNLRVSTCKEKHELVQMILRFHDISWRQPQTIPPRPTAPRQTNFTSTNVHDRSSLLVNPETQVPVASRPEVPDSSIPRHNVTERGPGSRETNNGTGTRPNIRGESASTEEKSVPVPQPVPTGNRNKLLISDITMVAQIDILTAREMKQILTDNFVDYKGCVEKSELRIRVKNLYHDKSENEKRQKEQETNNSLNSDNDICKICWDGPIDCVLLECGHMTTCTACGKRLNECPICRQYVVRCVHVFRT